MIKFAREKFSSQMNLGFYLSDAQEFNFKNSFDLVTSSFCMQWVPNKEKAFRSIYHCLKQDGIAILVMPFRNNALAEIRKDLTRQKKWRDFFIDFNDPSDYMDDNFYDQYAINSGLSVRSYVTESISVKYENKESLMSFLSIITSNLSRLTEIETKKDFMHDIMEKYLDNTPSLPDGSCMVTFRCAKLIAIKKTGVNI